MIFRVVAFLFCLLASAFAKPNIIYINADDLGIMDVGFNSERYLTPNIDRLRMDGMLFTDAYAPAANCAPSRACVMSGQYTPRHGVYTVGNSDRGNSKDRKLIPIKNTEHLGLDNLTVAAALQAGGYKTIHLGKWHVGNDPLQQGFDVNIGGDHSGSPTGGYFSPFDKGSMKPFNEVYPKGTHRVDIFADQAIKFMRENRKSPFFMHMAFYSVHSKLEPVPRFIKKYSGRKDIDPVYE
jgi:arylsulfatase A-like enzyme